MSLPPANDSPAVVSPRAVERVRGGGPWVMRDEIAAAPVGGGDVVRVVDRRGGLLGTGIWSGSSPIALRMLGRGEAAPRALDEALLEARIGAAEERRRRIHGLRAGRDGEVGDGAARDRGEPGAVVDAYRVVHAEADLLPGLFIDRYGDVAVVQTGCAAMDARKAVIAAVLRRRLGVRLVACRDDGSARDFEGLPRVKGILDGEGPTRVAFHDAGSSMEADVLVDGKTGSFLDQQENHARAASYARPGMRALDAFSYHGGFALALGRAGAVVTALDENPAAVERLRRNAERNGIEVEARADNAFDVLRAYEAERRRFDLVVIDPPAFAKRRSALPAAERAYKELNLRALRLLVDGGILVTCSCSGKLTPERFGAVVLDAARDAGRPVQLLERRGAGRDHPTLLGLPETEYLKCWIARVVG